MLTSDKKRKANQVNSQKSKGPKNTTSTRYNAVKHGLLAKGVTSLDDVRVYKRLLSGLRDQLRPVGLVEEFLVEAAAIEMTRVRRARLLEAEYVTSVLNPPVTEPAEMDMSALEEPKVLDPGLPAAIDSESALCLVNTFQRYESVLVQRVHKTLHELERIQRMRRGESVPAPAAVDVDLHIKPTGQERIRRQEPVLTKRPSVKIESGAAQYQERQLDSTNELTQSAVKIGASSQVIRDENTLETHRPSSQLSRGQGVLGIDRAASPWMNVETVLESDEAAGQPSKEEGALETDERNRDC